MDSAPPPHRLASGLASRVTHDLAGGLSGLSAALGLLDDADPQIRDEAASLARQAYAALEQKLAFCRAAFGRNGEAQNPGALARLSNIFFDGGRSRLTLQITTDVVAEPAGQALLVLAQLAAQSCGRNGEARLILDGREGDWGLALAVRGERAKLPGDAAAGLTGRELAEGESSGRWALGAYVRALAMSAGASVGVRESEAGFDVEIVMES